MKYILKFSLFLILSLVSVLAFIFGYDFFMKRLYPLEYETQVKLSCEKYDVDPALVFAVIKTESNFRKDAESSAGAVGLMQLMPKTFDDLQKDINNHETMDEKFLKDPETNIEYGVYFLSELLKKYENENTAITAYNAGGGRVDQWLDNQNDSASKEKTIKNIPFKETKDYLEKVSKTKKIYQKLYFKEN